MRSAHEQVIANAGLYNDKGALADVDLGEFEELFKVNVSPGSETSKSLSSEQVSSGSGGRDSRGALEGLSLRDDELTRRLSAL